MAAPRRRASNPPSWHSPPRPRSCAPAAFRARTSRPCSAARLQDYRETGVLSPGQLASHYAPRSRLRLDATACEAGELLLAFGPGAPEGALNLSPSGDLREAAANLFAYLRALDAQGPARIAVMPIPRHGLGEAIDDRLRRASAPRSAHK